MQQFDLMTVDQDSDYQSAIVIITTARLLKRWAFCVFTIPLLGIVIAYWLGAGQNTIGIVAVIFGLPSFVLFMKLRVPTPRIRWQDDFRGPLLILRSFSDDRLKTGDMLPPGEVPFPNGPVPNNFAWQAALALWDVARVVMVQREEGTITPIFGIVVESNEENWKADVQRAAQGAWAILLFPSSSPGVVEEMLLLRELKLLWKTVVFMPPVTSKLLKLLMPLNSFVDYATRWASVRNELGYHEIDLPPYEPQGMLFIPNDRFRADRILLLNYNDCPWERITELLDPSTAHPKSLIECISVARSREL